MTSTQKLIKTLATAFAIFLCVVIFYSIINVALAILVPFDSADIGTLEEHKISSSIKSLDIEVSAANVKIIHSDKFCVKSNLKRLEIKEGYTTAEISHPEGFLNRYNEQAMVEIYIPHTLKKLDIEMGAGALKANGITAEKLDLQLGAGSATLKNITTSKSTEIDSGAGEIKITDSTLCRLDAELGVGEFTFSGELTKKADFDMGIGDSSITLDGGSDDYRFSVNKGLGDVKIDGHSVTSGTDIGSTDSCKITLNGGIGSIDVDFKN